MSLRRQLFLVLSVLFLAVLMAILVVSISGTRQYLEQQLASHAQDAATAMSITLAQSLGKDDRALAEAQVVSVFDRGYFKRIDVLGADRRVLVSKELPEQIDGVPLWFPRWVPIQSAVGEAFVTAGWRQLGKVAVMSQPTFAYQHLWRTMMEQLAWLAAIYAGSLVLMQGVLRVILQPLLSIEKSARSVQEKRFEQILALPRAPELARVVKAMNDMSRRVSEMLDAETAKAESLRRQAHDDEATGLANRRGFELRLNDLLEGDASFSLAAIIAIEFDDMRTYNRTHGFREGNALMQAVADAARELIAGDHVAILARTNEYSFSFVVAELTAEKVVELATTLHQRLAHDVEKSPAAGHVWFSIGVAYFHQADKRTDVFARADLAVESARQSGRNGLTVLPDVREENSSLGSFGWRMLIQNAMAENRWLLVSQPVVRLNDPASRFHSELMARLIDSHGHLVPASQFLPMAARHRLMVDIDRALFTLALGYLKDHERESIAINLSPQSIADADFIVWFGEQLAALKETARRLSVELSEFGVVRHTAAAEQVRKIVRRQGASFGIDHFGIDPQALKLLRQLPPDYVKLAGSLITDQSPDETTQAMLQSIVQLAHSLDVKVIAQNVEFESQVTMLLAANIEGGQGYLFGAPA